jgi:hypothetical protein
VTSLQLWERAVLDAELVNVALNGFTKAWEPFIMGICAREHLPNWERLWDDCIQQETHTQASKQGGGSADENLALVSKTKKGKAKVFKKVDSQGEGQQSGQKRDMSKIKCYIFHKNGHFASQCPLRKKNKGKPQTVAAAAETQLSELASKFENDFSFVSCLSTSTTSRGTWYLDSGASCHMTEERELFNNFSEGDSSLHVELGNEAKYAVRGQGTVQFQLESGGSFDAQEVLYVPGLKKNLLSISVMEDKGYEVNFRRGHVFIRPEGASPDTA